MLDTIIIAGAIRNYCTRGTRVNNEILGCCFIALRNSISDSSGFFGLPRDALALGGARIPGGGPGLAHGTGATACLLASVTQEADPLRGWLE